MTKMCTDLQTCLQNNVSSSQSLKPLLHMCSIAPVEEFASMVSKITHSITVLDDTAAKAEEMWRACATELVKQMTNMMKALQQSVENMQRQSRGKALQGFVTAEKETYDVNWFQQMMENIKRCCNKKIQQIEKNGSLFAPEDTEKEPDSDVIAAGPASTAVQVLWCKRGDNGDFLPLILDKVKALGGLPAILMLASGSAVLAEGVQAPDVVLTQDDYLDILEAAMCEVNPKCKQNVRWPSKKSLVTVLDHCVPPHFKGATVNTHAQMEAKYSAVAKEILQSARDGGGREDWAVGDTQRKEDVQKIREMVREILRCPLFLPGRKTKEKAPSYRRQPTATAAGSWEAAASEPPLFTGYIPSYSVKTLVLWALSLCDSHEIRGNCCYIPAIEICTQHKKKK